MLWLAFVGLWARVFQHTELREVGVSLRLLLGVVVLYGITVAIWVGHNISLARRRNRRRASQEIAVFPSHDCLGLRVEIRLNLVTEQEIEIRIVDGVKQYLSRHEPADLERLDAAVAGDRREAGEEAAILASQPPLSKPGTRR